MKLSGRNLAVFSIGCFVCTAALAQSAQETVERLNREAMQAYLNLDINRAGAILEEAARVGQSGTVTAQERGKTHLGLGVVYVGGLNDTKSGASHFVVGLCFDASLTLDAMTSTPAVRAAFEEARAAVQAGGCSRLRPPGAASSAAGVGFVKVEPIVHMPPPAQQSQTPLPIYVELNQPAERLRIYYRGAGMQSYEQAEMFVYGRGAAYQISCELIFEPEVSYYIEAVDEDGRRVASVGSAVQPMVVPVQSGPVSAPPALPGADMPASCSAEECPPGLECALPGRGAIGEACSASTQCQGGLTCVDEVCTLEGAGDTDVSGLAEAGGGWGEAGGDAGRTDRFFVNLSFALGLPWLQSGMPADRPADPDEVFVDVGTGQRIPLGVVVDESRLLIPDDQSGPEYFPGQVTEWVPDADSNDGLSMGAGIGGSCPADGVETGPGFVELEPSSYCVRVQSPGFAPQAALRLAAGYFFMERLAGSVVARLQPSAGAGTLSSLLLGARAEYALSKPVDRGFFPSLFAGLTLGQIQAQPEFASSDEDSPWIQSGLFGVHAGAAIRFRIVEHFGLIAAPEIDLLFPDVLFNIDLPLGVEATF